MGNSFPLLNNLSKLFDKLIIIFLILSLLLISIMALFSGYNKHPDEHLHHAAIQYYYDHWLPPQVGDQSTFNSYSKYGASYLNNLEILYFLNGKFSQVAHSILSNNYQVDRLFNVLLFLLLVCYCAYKGSARIMFIILIITPQLWYVFSYLNGDAFPFFLSFVIVGELVTKDSLYYKYLKSNNYLQSSLAIIFLATLLSLLFLCKYNYIILIVYIIFILAWNILNYPDIDKKRILIRNILLISIAFSLFLIIKIYDISINNFEKNDKIMLYAEKFAAPQYKLSQKPYNSFYFLRLKEKKIKYSELFSLMKWHVISYLSFVGTYGWLTIYGSSIYYSLMGFILILFIIFIVLSVLYKSTIRHIIYFIITVFFIIVTVFISTYYSWVIDFQPQGRYLFPILIMLSTVLYMNRRVFNQGILTIIVIALFSMSIYSFIFVGLANLLK